VLVVSLSMVLPVLRLLLIRISIGLILVR